MSGAIEHGSTWHRFLGMLWRMKTLSASRNSAKNRRFWEKQAARLRWRLNVGWVLELVRIPLAVSGGGAALLLVAMRRGGLGTEECAAFWGVGLAVGVALGMWRARHRWVRADAAFARLDVQMGWNSRLSAARQGVGEWPEPVVEAGRGMVRWKVGRVFGPWAGVLVLGLAALWVPARVVQARRNPVERPPSVQQIEALLAELEQNTVLAPENLESFKEQLEQLKSKAPGEWYSHNALEAAAQLKAELESGTRLLGEYLSRLEEAFEPVAGPDPGPEQFVQMQQQLRDALQAASASPMAIDPELAKRLRESADKSGMDSKDLQDLKERLQKARECAQCKNPRFKGEGDAVRRKQRNSGTEGGESEELTFNAKPTELGTASEEALPQGDLAKALPGETVLETRLAPRAEGSSGIAAPGATSAEQAGAQAVWRQRPVSPAEQRRLRTYFGN